MKKVFSGLAVVCAAAIIIASCGSGGGGAASSGPGPAAYHSPEEAAASANSGASAPMIADSLAGTVSGFGIVPMPAGLAPQLKAKRAKAAAASLDPRLKTLLDNVSSKSKTAMVQAALQKTSALKASLVNTINATYTTDAGCTTSGNVKIVGQNNFDDGGRTYDDKSYTFTYNACSDGTAVVNGSLILNAHDAVSGLGWTDSMQMSNLTFYDSSSGETVALNATFGDVGSLTDFSNGTETFTANGSFVDTLSTGEKIKFTFGSLSKQLTVSSDVTQETVEVAVNGSVSFSVKDNTGAVLFAFSMSFSGFTDKYQYLYDGLGTEKEWLNGTVALSWSPALAGCSPGTVTLTTADATPITWTTAGGLDPVSGTLKVNSATVEFATPSGTQITVTLSNGTSTVFTDMASFVSTSYVCLP